MSRWLSRRDERLGGTLKLSSQIGTVPPKSGQLAALRYFSSPSSQKNFYRVLRNVRYDATRLDNQEFALSQSLCQMSPEVVDWKKESCARLNLVSYQKKKLMMESSLILLLEMKLIGFLIQMSRHIGNQWNGVILILPTRKSVKTRRKQMANVNYFWDEKGILLVWLNFGTETDNPVGQILSDPENTSLKDWALFSSMIMLDSIPHMPLRTFSKNRLKIFDRPL